MGCDTPQTYSGVSIPDTNYLVIASRSYKSRVVRKLAASKTFGMARQFLDILASIDVPKLDLEISTAADNGITPHLHSIDGARMPSELLQHCTGLSIPHADCDILRTGNNIAVIESKIKYGGGVMLKSHNWPIIVLDIVDNARAVR
jgi:hypothetical protein